MKSVSIIGAVILSATLSACASAPSGRSVDVQAEQELSKQLKGCPYMYQKVGVEACERYKKYIKPFNVMELFKSE